MCTASSAMAQVPSQLLLSTSNQRLDRTFCSRQRNSSIESRKCLPQALAAAMRELWLASRARASGEESTSSMKRSAVFRVRGFLVLALASVPPWGRCTHFSSFRTAKTSCPATMSLVWMRILAFPSYLYLPITAIPRQRRACYRDYDKRLPGRLQLTAVSPHALGLYFSVPVFPPC